MPPTNVALDGEACELPSRRKKPDERFSDTVKRLARPRRPFSEFGGMWSDLSDTQRKELDQTCSNLKAADRRRAVKIR
jgi:hypothetical protein